MDNESENVLPGSSTSMDMGTQTNIKTKSVKIQCSEYTPCELHKKSTLIKIPKRTNTLQNPFKIM